MTLTITIPEPVGRRLAAEAAAAGKSVEALAGEALAAAFAPPDREETFAEIMAPVGAEFAESGMTEEELDALIKEARAEVRAEWRRRKSP